MLRRSSYAAASLERPRLIAPHVLLGIGVFVLVLLALLYPYRELVQYALNATRGDTLTIAYLRNLLRTDAQNPELRLALVRQSLARRDYAEARASLQPLLAERLPTGVGGWDVLSAIDQVLHAAAHLFLDSELRDRVRDIVDIDGLMRHHGTRPGHGEVSSAAHR